MRAEVIPSSDTTTLYLRWEVIPEGGELDQMRELGGPVTLELEATDYVDVGGKYHETAAVEVPIFPFDGPRNFGQAKFTDHESRRSFMERLQGAVVGDVANFVADTEPGSLDVEGHVIRVAETRAR